MVLKRQRFSLRIGTSLATDMLCWLSRKKVGAPAASLAGRTGTTQDVLQSNRLHHGANPARIARLAPPVRQHSARASGNQSVLRNPIRP